MKKLLLILFSGICLLFLLTGLILPSDRANAQVQNLLTNGGFESGSVAPWQNITNTQLTTTQVHSGIYAVSIAGGQNPSQGWISVTPGKTYVFSGWFKWVQFAGSNWGYDTMKVTNSDWSEAAAINNLHSSYEKNKWNKIALTFTPKQNQVMVNFGVYGPQDTVELYFDDFLLFEKTGNVSPTINPVVSTTSGSAPLTVNFSANGDDPDGAIQYFSWDFGDGSVDTRENPTHAFVSRGTFPVTLSVWDNDKAKVTKSLTITVTDQVSPLVAITGPTALDTYTTSSSSVSVSGTAAASSGNIAFVTWDDVSTGKAGVISIMSGATVNWSTGNINLKPGKNEILISATDSQGRVGTDRLVITRQIFGPAASNISVNSTSVRQYEKYEVKFDLATVAEYPFFKYDENPPPGVPPRVGVTVEGVFTVPSGRTLRQPGFFMTETVVSGNPAVPSWQDGGLRFVETTSTSWAVRFSPQETGQYQVSLSVRDASGIATVPVGAFQASAPVRNGFIRVSQQDTRYFEFTNGDLYWPIGPAGGIDYAKYKDTGLNFERPWMIGSGAYTTNAARWKSSAETLGNEGFMTRLSYKEHYPGQDLSYEMFYPEGYRMWLTCWGDDDSCFRLKRGAQYQIKLRLKIANLTGPDDNRYAYGFVVKTHGWPESDPLTFQNTLRNFDALVPYINQNRDWHTVMTTYVADEDRDTWGHISMYLDNVTGGQAYIDEFSVREILAGGSLGPEQIRNSRADPHTYVDPRGAGFFDWQVEQGEQNGVFFQYVVMDKNDWVPNHLLDVGVFHDQGGGYYQPDGTKTRWLLEQWWRYLIGRWGYSTAVRSWELNNEGPPDDGSGTHAWATQDFAKFMHQNDAHPHLASTSFWCCWKPTFWSDKVNFPDVDYADWHRYTADQAEIDDVAGFVNTISQTTILPSVDKPAIIAETGLFQNGAPIPQLNNPNPGIWYHDLLWAQLNSGSVSFPNYWDAGHINNIQPNHMAVSKPFFQFVSGLDVNKGGYVDIVPQSAISNSNLRIFGQKNLVKNKAYVWLQNKNHDWQTPSPAAQSGTVKIKVNPTTTYDVKWWDTYAGSVTKTEILTSNSAGELTLVVTNLTSDVAVKIVSEGYVEPTPTPPTTPKPGDIDGNGQVNVQDLKLVLGSWLGSGSCDSFNCDVKPDGKLNTLDAAVVIYNFDK